MTVAQYDMALTTGAVRLTVSARTDRGLVRTVNEDSHLADHGVFLVADGMGGHSYGDRASQIVVDTFSDTLRSGARDRLTPEHLISIIRDANERVLGLPVEADAVCGTTLSGVALVAAGVEQHPHWMAFNIGDSRVYEWDGRTLKQVTVDHSAVEELLASGSITPDEALRHPQRNVITRALGVDSDVDADVWLLPLRDQHTFVVCSDGLSKELDDDLIATILADVTKLATGQALADRLVEAALAAGGADNVTVVVVESRRIGAAAHPNPDTVDDTLDRDSLHALEQTQPRR